MRHRWHYGSQMRNSRHWIALFIATVALSGCAGSDESASQTATQPTATVTVTETPEAAPGNDAKPEPRSLYPAGFPKTVAVADMPSPVRDQYELSGHKQAVAIAPGVWSPLTPGAKVQDAATSGIRDGFCASVQAYERKFRPPLAGGSCY